MIPQAEIERTFALIEQAAIKGERCPMNHPFGPLRPAVAVNLLCLNGRIRLEISGQNFRRAVILTGPHKGKSTAHDPKGHEVWKIVDVRGNRDPRERRA